MTIYHAPLQRDSAHEAGLALLQKAYRAQYGTPTPPLCSTDRGKPYFADSAVHFSITHTKKNVFCVLSDRPVGIDAEEMDRPIKPALAKKILSPSEQEKWEASTDKAAALLRLWVLKEARAKFLGTGLTGYPNHTDFSPEDPRITISHGCYVAVVQEEDYAL